MCTRCHRCERRVLRQVHLPCDAEGSPWRVVSHGETDCLSCGAVLSEECLGKTYEAGEVRAHPTCAASLLASPRAMVVRLARAHAPRRARSRTRRRTPVYPTGTPCTPTTATATRAAADRPAAHQVEDPTTGYTVYTDYGDRDTGGR